MESDEGVQKQGKSVLEIAITVTCARAVLRQCSPWHPAKPVQPLKLA